MKKFYSNNNALAEILVANGVNLICDENMNISVSDEDADRIPQIVNELAPASYGDYALSPVYTIYYTDDCESFHFDKKSFDTLEEAISFCDNYVRNERPYNWTDTPATNNHYCLEVYDGDPAEQEALYQTRDYYKN